MYFSKPKNGTASFGDVFKTKNEGDAYHFLELYFKDDFWSVLLKFLQAYAPILVTIYYKLMY